MIIQPITDMARQQWDCRIASFDTRLLYHGSPWSDVVEKTFGATPVRFEIVQNAKTMGYLPGHAIRKMGFKILGTPLSGWETDFMGPVVNEEGFDREAFLEALDEMAIDQGYDFVQIGHPVLPPELMEKRGYVVQEWVTNVIPLNEDPEVMWRHIDGKCRNRIRKGLKNKLSVEQDTGDSFAEEYHGQLIEVFARQNLRPRYSKQFVKNLLASLSPSGQVIALRIKHENTTIATGVFPHDHHNVFSIGIASRIKYRHLCPNELLYWSVMCMAGKRGARRFYVGGPYRKPPTGGDFKAKFNASKQSYFRYAKAHGLLPKIGHFIYKIVHERLFAGR